MKFVDTKRFSPVIFEGDLPHQDDYFHKKSEEITDDFLKSGDYYIDEAWWFKQIDRCTNGYEVPNAIVPGGNYMVDGEDAFWTGNDCYIPDYDLVIKNRKVWISGRHYFYLNFWPIYAKVEGVIGKRRTNPKFLALDFWFAMRLELMVNKELDNQELKARQIGATEKAAGMIMGYNYTFIEESLNVIVGGIEADAAHTMDSCNAGLKHLKNTQLFHERSLGKGEKPLHIRAKHTGSEIWALTAKDNPQTISRFSPFWIYYEEVGKGKKEWSLKVARYVKPSIITEGVKTGYQTFVGTAGEMDEGTYDLEQRHYNPEKFGILSFRNRFEETEDPDQVKSGHFIGKQVYHLIDKDGNPLIKESIEDIEEERKTMKRDERMKDETQRPFYAGQVFQSSIIGFFGEEIIRSCNSRATYIKNHRSEQKTRIGRLEAKDSTDLRKGVYFVDDENGWLEVLEEPEVDKKGNVVLNLYKAGIDSYDQDEAQTSDSKGSMVVKKGLNPFSDSPYYNCPVALIHERPTVAEGGAPTFYKHTIMVNLWYKIIAKCNIEYSNLRIFDYYDIHGFSYMLLPRPRLAFAGMINERSKVSNKYGTDKSLKAPILSILRDSLDDIAIMRIYFRTILKKIAAFKLDPDYNCDVTMAYAECEVASKETEMIAVETEDEKSKDRRRGVIIYTTDANGVPQQKIV